MNRTPRFEIRELGDGCLALNDCGRTVAIVTGPGNIDWLLRSPPQPGPLLTALCKETHYSYTLGLQLYLHMITPFTAMRATTHRVLDNGARVWLQSDSASPDGNFTSRTTAALQVDAAGRWYEWHFETVLRARGSQPVALPHDWIEYNNLYPSKAGRGFLFAPQKEFQSTFLTDREGVCWEFPHQHLMHYTRKIDQRQFAAGTVGGFWDEPAGNPVVHVHQASVPPHWGICDMYYDLHCGARLPGPIQPGEEFSFAYTIHYLDSVETRKLRDRARRVPVHAPDYVEWNIPRLELGLNHFDKPVRIDQLDEACGFRPMPPQKAWDKEVGCSAKGSLRITNDRLELTTWAAVPPSQAAPSSRIRITGKVKTLDVEGKGLFVRLTGSTFCWKPTPHTEYLPPLESQPVSGTTAGWVLIEVPELRLTADQFDYCVSIEVILDGKGVGWLTDVEIQLATDAR